MHGSPWPVSECAVHARAVAGCTHALHHIGARSPVTERLSMLGRRHDMRGAGSSRSCRARGRMHATDLHLQAPN